ncbi:hypothetical protein ES708_02520 [subsurface metagenome]
MILQQISSNVDIKISLPESLDEKVILEYLKQQNTKFRLCETLIILILKG